MIGLGTYAFLWHHWSGNPARIDLSEALRRTRALGVDLFQICDYEPLGTMSEAGLDRVRAEAADLGVALEVGTRGVTPGHLQRWAGIAARLGATLLRSMVVPSEAALPDAERALRQVIPRCEDLGVDLALETYEQIPSRDLVALVEAIGRPGLGICLDPANCVAALEHPLDVARRCAPYVKNMHVKDFRFTRREGWVGFTLEGAPLGDGLLDLDALTAIVRPEERGISRVVEHWLPFEDPIERTLALEDHWTGRSLDRLRRT